MRQCVTETLIVFVLGGAGGVALAFWALAFLGTLTLPGPFPVGIDIAPDGGVVLFALTLALTTGLVFGLLPARHAVSLDVLSALKDEAARPRSSAGKLRRAFVAAQVAASLVLMAAAGLLLRALQQAGQIETGFDTDGAYVTFLDLTTEGYASEDGSAFHDEIVAYFSGQPWVESVALSIDLPLDMSTHGIRAVPEGWRGTAEREYVSTRYNAVSPDYFEALRIAVLEGRGFRAFDREGAQQVAVVSRAFAERFWPGESAVGRRIQAGDTVTVVGVVADVPNQTTW
jgi:hypothetical protein